jgi:hypothetical protein
VNGECHLKMYRLSNTKPLLHPVTIAIRAGSRDVAVNQRQIGAVVSTIEMVRLDLGYGRMDSGLARAIPDDGTAESTKRRSRR